MAKPLDYSKWNTIEISDDEDDVHPNIDKESLWRWKKQAREERDRKAAEEKQRVKEEHAKIKSKLIEVQQAPSDEAQKQLDELKRQEEEYAKKEAEIERMEKLYPKWNSSNMCHDAWSKTIIEKKTDQPKSEEEIGKEQAKFFKEHKDDIRKFGLLKTTDESENFLMEHPALFSEFTANYLVVWAVDCEVEEKHERMKTIARQTILMQYLIEFAKNVSKPKPLIVKSFFAKFRLAEAQYMSAYKEEVDALIGRVEKRAKERIEEAVKEYEEEERQKRIAASPGGLDPQEVMESLPQSLRDAFESRDIGALQAAIAEMPLEEAKYHIDRCTKSGLWVPGNSDKAEEDEQDEQFHDAVE
eukprot:comp9081_c0_seq1/m.4256 comp9081_c0_seq1/g.4256  ORF comp9081_c0_seq1/g.4256 comp9081_c0_seq1/m.4256 type:complete len:357 (-) comp9081_c0_seq1:620-1690(-)